MPLADGCDRWDALVTSSRTQDPGERFVGEPSTQGGKPKNVKTQTGKFFIKDDWRMITR